MTECERSFCIFNGDAGPMAVGVESVSAVLETHSLVPLAWRPPRVIGLCAYHREVIPVIALGPIGKDADGPHASGSHSAAAAGDGDEEEPRGIVLILRTAHESWGLRIDRTGTCLGRVCPKVHPPRVDDRGAVLIGAFERDGKSYAILDAEATWRELRSAVVRWYGVINESGFYGALSPGENARELATVETG